MSKTIIPFTNASKWETKSDCLFCETIDKIYKLVPTLPTYEEQQQKLSSLDDSLVVDGYELLNVYEGLGEIMAHPNNIDRIGLYPSNRVSFMKKVHNVLYPNDPFDLSGYRDIDEPLLIHSRWCRKCAKRKPDIFDSLKNEELNLLPINNLIFTIDNSLNVVHFDWSDSKSEIWDNSKLIRSDKSDMSNSIVITSYNLTNPRQVDITDCPERGQVYYYQILNYDVTNTLIQRSEILEVYIPIEDIIPPDAIADFSIRQVREIDIESLVARDYLLMDWTDPPNDDYEGTIIRMGELELTPSTEKEGIEVKRRHLINLPNEIGTTYFFRPFPYDKLKYKPATNGIGYYSYCNYNRDSIPNYFTIKQQLSDVSDIEYKIEDEQVTLNWTDPPEDKWVGTMIRYKKGGIILHKDDGVLVTVTDIKDYFKKGNNSLVIPNLENNVEYSIGIFPISSEDVCNISLENQFKAITGFYKEDIDIKFTDPNWREKMFYVGKFKVADDLVKGKVLTNPVVEPSERIICFIEGYDLRYGALLTLDYSCSTFTNYDYCKIYINDEELLYITGYKRWSGLSYEIPSMDYVKITIEWVRNYPYDISSYIKFSNINLKYNSHI